MKLIPEKLYDKLMLLNKLNLTQANETDDEKSIALDGDFPDEVKIMLYQQAARNLIAKDTAIKNTPVLVKNVDPVPTVPVIPPAPPVPTPLTVIKSKGLPGIFMYLRSLNILPSDANEISINGIPIPKSNYNDLLSQFSGIRKKKDVIGFEQVVGELQKYHIPENLFPKHILKSIMDENTPSGPSVSVPKRKLFQEAMNTRSKTKWSGVK